MPFPNNVAFTTHAIEQMDDRGIESGRVKEALANGEIIDEYESNEQRRYLLLHTETSKTRWYQGEGVDITQQKRPLHVVAADQSQGLTIVITAYNPRKGPGEWSDDFRTRLS